MTTMFNATCWSCGYRMDAHSAVGYEDATPKPGDWSVCLACGELAVYSPALGALVLREPTAAEREVALKDDVIVQTMFAQRQARATSTSWPRGPRESAS